NRILYTLVTYYAFSLLNDPSRPSLFSFFSSNAPATTEIYTLSLHDALPISPKPLPEMPNKKAGGAEPRASFSFSSRAAQEENEKDRKSTRLNSSHDQISYAVFCLKKKKSHEDVLPNPAKM